MDDTVDFRLSDLLARPELGRSVSQPEVRGLTSTGKPAEARFLSALDPQVNVTNTYGRTPLHKASFCGHVDTVQGLIQRGDSVHAVDSDGETPLHKASRCGRAQTVQLLLQNSATVNTPNSAGNTPLHVACAAGRTDTVPVLLRYGADITLTNKLNHTAHSLVSAISKWRRPEEIVSLLAEESRKDANVTD